MIKPTEGDFEVLKFYDPSGFEVEDAEHLTQLLEIGDLHVEIDGDGRRIPVFSMKRRETEVLSAWFIFASAMSKYRAESADAAIDKLKGYPRGTTLADVKSGKPKLTVVGGGE